MNNKPRPKAKLSAPSMNAPRPTAPGKLDPQIMARLNTAHITQGPGKMHEQSAATLRLNTHVGQGPGRMHERSTNRLHEERAYIYDKMSKNKLTGAALDMKASVATNLTSKDRNALSKETESLRPFKRQFKANNPEGARAETIAKAAKYTKLGANVANHAGTAVAFVNPVAGGATKLAAKGVSVAAGIAATAAYSEASKAYAANANPNATGRDMLSSQMAQVKSDINAQKRDHMGAMTAFGAVTAGVVDGLDEVAEMAGGAMEVMSKATNRTAKAAGGVGLQLGLEMKERENKSEFVNLLQHQRALAPKSKLKRQNGTRNVNQGAWPHLQRQNASRPLKGS